MSNFHILEGNLIEIEKLECFDPNTTNIILNVVNCQGKLATGYNFRLAEKYPNIVEPYTQIVDSIPKNERKSLLGQFFSVQVASNIHIVNIFAQQYYGKESKRYLSYDSLVDGLYQFKSLVGCENPNIDIYMPYMIGCDKAGGNIHIVSAIVESVLGSLPNRIIAVKFTPSPNFETRTYQTDNYNCQIQIRKNPIYSQGFTSFHR